MEKTVNVRQNDIIGKKNYFRETIEMENKNCIPSAICSFKVDYAFNKKCVKRIKSNFSPSKRDFKQNVYIRSSMNAETVMEQRKNSLRLPVLN